MRHGVVSSPPCAGPASFITSHHIYCSARSPAYTLWPWRLPQAVLSSKGALKPSQRQDEVCEKKMFIFGVGYVGLALARCLRSQDWDVSGTCADHERREALQESGWQVFHFNSDNDGEELGHDGLRAMSGASHIIVTIPPVADFDRDPVLSIYREQLSHMATSLNLCWIGYLSSTGVYGDNQGDWVDESSQPKPSKGRALARLDAEKAWLQFGLDTGVCVQVFRLGGIYGPGRSAVNTLLSLDKPSLKQLARATRQFTSRIHVTDICQAIVASTKSPCPGRIYNIVDDEPASRDEVFGYARHLIAEKWPSVASKLIGSAGPALSLEARKCLSEKRVMNKRMKEELGVQLTYPTYQSGLKSVIEELNL